MVALPFAFRGIQKTTYKTPWSLPPHVVGGLFVVWFYIVKTYTSLLMYPPDYYYYYTLSHSARRTKPALFS